MTKRLRSIKILKYAKKYKAIQLLGGKCESCGETRFFRLSFHHSDKNKEININELRKNRWELIEKEIIKCKLLCQNCHQELHSGKDTIYKRSKEIYLEFKKVKGCKQCGYNKCNASLTFHHISDKKFKLCGCRSTNINNIKEKIINELNKCDVLCCNCHQELHSDLKFFQDNINLIIEKSKNLRKISGKIDREIVKKMYFIDKKKQIEIVKFFDCSKGVISDIIKELNTNNGL